MINRTRGTTARRGLAALSIAAAGLALATATPAAATGKPAFLSPAELPPHPSSSWSSGDILDGLPHPLPFCFGGTLPGTTSQYREFWTDLDANATQVTVVSQNETTAATLAALWEESIQECAHTTVEQDPDASADWRDLGSVDVEEGAHLYGVHVAHSWGATDIHLFAVGRDGNAVTLVRWGQMGDFQDANPADFEQTARTAVNKLY